MQIVTTGTSAMPKPIDMPTSDKATTSANEPNVTPVPRSRRSAKQMEKGQTLI